jgi:hypothetical protein
MLKVVFTFWLHNIIFDVVTFYKLYKKISKEGQNINFLERFVTNISGRTGS